MRRGRLAELRREALDAAFSALEPLGFRRRLQWLATVDVGDEELEGQLSLADRPRPHWGTVEFAPYISIRDHDVESAVRRLWPNAQEDRHAATYTVQLGYLMPEHRWEVFGLVHDDAVDAQAVVRLAAAVRDHALPFLRRNADRCALLRTLEAERDANRDVLQLPILLAFAGKRRRAKRLVEQTLRARPEFPGYGEFASAFEAFLDERR